MPAETRLFRCLSDNYGVLLHDPESGATASIDAPEAAPIEAALKADRLEAHRYPGHPPPPRPHRRHRGAEEKIPLPRGGAGGGSRQDPGGRRNRARGRQGFGRQIIGQCDRDARPYARPHHLLVPQGPDRLRRRHAVFHRLRPRDRGQRGDDVEFAEKTARPARRHRDLLRARIHRRQYQIRAHHRQGQSGAGRRAPRKSGNCSRRARRPFRSPSATRSWPIRSCAPTSPTSPATSAWPASRPKRCSRKSARARTSSKFRPLTLSA